MDPVVISAIVLLILAILAGHSDWEKMIFCTLGSKDAEASVMWRGQFLERPTSRSTTTSSSRLELHAHSCMERTMDSDCNLNFGPWSLPWSSCIRLRGYAGGQRATELRSLLSMVNLWATTASTSIDLFPQQNQNCMADSCHVISLTWLCTPVARCCEWNSRFSIYVSSYVICFVNFNFTKMKYLLKLLELTICSASCHSFSRASLASISEPKGFTKIMFLADSVVV